MDKLQELSRDLGAQFADFLHTPSASNWTYMASRMAAYQHEWTVLDEKAQVDRLEAQNNARMVHDYEA